MNTVDGSGPTRIRSHRDLVVWQKAMGLVDLVYALTDQFPSQEEHRLTSQLIRAAISVPANIAEGQARSTSRDFAHFLILAKASLMETDTHVEIAVRRGYISEGSATDLFTLISEISRMLTTLRNRIANQGHRH